MRGFLASMVPDPEGTYSEPRYKVGTTLTDNVPCIIHDGDSVLCVFPSNPYGKQQAQAVCDILNNMVTGSIRLCEFC